MSQEKIKRALPQLSICRLHVRLCELANQEGIIECDIETLRKNIFPDDSVDIKNLLAELELNNLLTLGPNHVKLAPWPQFGCRQSATKTERFERDPWHEPDPVQSSNAIRDAATKRHLQKSGLTGLHYPPAFGGFLKAWPKQPISSDQKKFAWREWEALDRSKALPDISLLIIALKTTPPGPRTWPGTWLRQKSWQKPVTKVACTVCYDEGIVYGVRPDGTKGALPCPKCKK